MTKFTLTEKAPESAFFKANMDCFFVFSSAAAKRATVLKIPSRYISRYPNEIPRSQKKGA